jgi:hypothetical protein
VRLIDDRTGSTQDSIHYFQRHRGEFGEFIEANVFFLSEDMVESGFYEVSDSDTSRLDRFQMAKTGSLVLRDAAGNELWLTGCLCGYRGEGVGGSMTVLKEAGFPSDLTELLPYYRVASLRKGSNVAVVARESVYYQYLGEDFRDGDEMVIVDGRIPAMVLTSRNLPAERLREKCELYLDEWIDSPLTVTLFISDEEARLRGYSYPSEKPKSYNLIIRGSSSRELWLRVPLPDELRTSQPIAARFWTRVIRRRDWPLDSVDAVLEWFGFTLRQQNRPLLRRVSHLGDTLPTAISFPEASPPRRGSGSSHSRQRTHNVDSSVGIEPLRARADLIAHLPEVRLTWQTFNRRWTMLSDKHARPILVFAAWEHLGFDPGNLKLRYRLIVEAYSHPPRKAANIAAQVVGDQAVIGTFESDLSQISIGIGTALLRYSERILWELGVRNIGGSLTAEEPDHHARQLHFATKAGYSTDRRNHVRKELKESPRPDG